VADPDPFTQTTNPNDITPPATPEPPASDPFADQLGQIKDGEGNPKYKDTSTALSALNSSQLHITTLEAERANDRAEIERLREEVTKREAVEDVVNRLSQNTQVPPTKGETSPNANGLDADAVVNLIRQTFASNEQETVAKTNRTSVLQQLAAKFGDGEALNNAVAVRAAELGTTPANIGKMAEQTPELVLQLFGDVKTVANPTQSSTNVPVTNHRDVQPLKFEKSVARGGFNARELKERMMAVKAEVNKELGIE
jgi:hypothetical protein